MKKYICLSFVVMLGVFSACDYNDKNFEDLDDLSKPTNVAKYEYEITLSDITTIVNALNAKKTHQDSVTAKALNADKMFSDEAPAAELIPYALKPLYYTADKGSAANVTYDYKGGKASYLADLGNAPTYVLTAQDYVSVWGAGSSTGFLTPNHAPNTEIPGILKKDFPDAKEGDIKIIQYQYADQEPTGAPTPISLLAENFESYTTANSVIDQNGWTSFSEVGNKTWQSKYFATENNRYAQMSNGSSGEYTAWIISPAIDLSQTKNNELSFDVNVGYWTASCFDVLISTDNNAATNPAGVTWTNITSQFTIPTVPASGYGVFAPAGSGSLDNYSGTVYVAFKYNGSAVSDPKRTTTYQIDNVKVEGVDKNASGGSGPAPVPYTLNDVYTFTTSWRLYPNATILDPKDYSDMGVSTLTTATAAIYIPKYLALKYPYAIDGNVIAVVYKTSSGNAADEFEFKNNAWTVNTFIEKKVDQFVFAGADGWVFDPTLTVKMTKGKNPTDDYMMLVLYVKDKYAGATPGLINSYGDAEFYYGANANYGNISIREVDRLKDPAYAALTNDEEKKAFIKQRTEEGLGIYLTLKFPDATPQVSGIDVFAFVTADIFDVTGTVFTTYKYQCIAANPSKWEFIEIVE